MDDEKRIALENFIRVVPPHLRSLKLISVEPTKRGEWVVKWKVEAITDREKIKKASCELVDSLFEEIEKRLKSG